MSEALSDIFVLELTTMFAGPYCGQFLADMGAEVVKVEPLTGARGRQGGRQAGYSYAVNRNKESIALDLKSDRGRKILHSLVTQADVVLQNFRPGVIDRLGAGYEELSAMNPRLVYCSVSGYGDRGPLRESPGQDLLIQGLSGLMGFIGYDDRVSVPAGTFPSDSAAGMLSALAIMIALHERDRSGEGQHVQTSLLASLLATMPWELTEFMTNGRSPRRVGSGHYLSGPVYGAYPTSNGEIVMQGDLRLIAETLGCDPLLTDERFTVEASPQGFARLEGYRDEIRSAFETCLAERDRDEVLRDLSAAGVWCGPVLGFDEMCSHPQVAVNEMLTSYADPDLGIVRTVASPMRFSRTPVASYERPPGLGEQTNSVLARRLGVTDEEIERLREEQVIA